MALFSQTTYPLNSLVSMIDSGQLGLPDLQRPFVWNRTKVRDLFDSLYRGYPAGHFLFWSTTAGHGVKQIGAGDARIAPQKLIVDGQQRLTSAYAVLKGKPVINDEFKEVRIRIAFNPLTGEFEVANTAIDKDVEWVTDISEIWNGPGAYLFTQAFMENLRRHRELTPAQEAEIPAAIARLEQVQNYVFSAIELSSNLDPEQVAEVFVRVNSKGVTLNQADFILTLMSVYWDQGRRDLEAFAQQTRIPTVGKASAFNHFLDADASDLLRVTVGVAFRRARLSYVYRILQGTDLETGEVTEATRDEQFAKLETAQAQVLDLTNWHEFQRCLMEAGYRSGAMITSDNNIIYTYLLFLLGRLDYNVPQDRLRRLIARWFFMSTVTGRYTGTPETQVERDLARLRGAKTADDFHDVLDSAIGTSLTQDFWNVALPDRLDSSAAYSPARFAYEAALVILDAKVLFSRLHVRELLDPSIHSTRSAVERHHLFPKGYLNRVGISTVYRTNQIANYAFLEWPDNAKISDQKPADYFPEWWRDRVHPSESARQRRLHALPEGWESMDYDDFVRERRGLMAQVVKEAYEALESGGSHALDDNPDPSAPTHPPTVAELIEAEESTTVEFKSSARYPYDPKVPERVIHDSIVKTVAAFANTEGGTLGIGIADDLEILGIQPDLDMKGHDRDQYQNWLATLLETALGGAAAMLARSRFEDVGEQTVCLVDVAPSSVPVYAKTSKSPDVFFVRNNNSTRALSGPELVTYIQGRWAQP